MDTLLRNLSTSLSPRRIASPHAWVEHIPFAFYLMEKLQPARFIELGVHTGNSYLAFCQGVDVFHLNTKCTGVDTFKGDDHASHYSENILNELSAYHDPLYGHFSNLMQCTFDEAWTETPDASVDLLHIDGYHTLDAVEHDFSKWLPKMNSSGVILLHDINVWRDKFGVWRLWQDIKDRFPSLEFSFSHGLGIVAVGETIPTALTPLFDEPDMAERTFYLLGSRIRYEHLACRAKTERETSVQSRLYIDRGAEFSERDSMTASFDPNTKQIQFDLRSYPDAKRIRFDPFHDAAVITLTEVTCENEDGKIFPLTPSGHNALYHDETIFDFAARNPRFIFTLPDDQNIRSITITFDFLHTGVAALSYILGKLHRELSTAHREAGQREAQLLSQIERLKIETNQLHQNKTELESLPGIRIIQWLKRLTETCTDFRKKG